MTAPSPSILLQHAAHTLSTSGGRMTRQRRIILAAISTCSDHPTAEEIYQAAQSADPTLNLSTVYRTLRWLEQESLITSRHFEGEPHQDRFDPVAEPGIDHYHFRCTRCARIIEFDAPLLEQVKRAFSRQHGGQVTSASLILYGLCAECSTAAANHSQPNCPPPDAA